MTDYYLRSTDGNNGDNGLSWANAFATMAYAAVAMPANSRLFVSQNHIETHNQTSGNINFQSGVRVIGVDDTSGEPPTTKMIGNSITLNRDSTGNSLSVQFNGTDSGEWDHIKLILTQATGLFYPTIRGAFTDCEVEIGNQVNPNIAASNLVRGVLGMKQTVPATGTAILGRGLWADFTLVGAGSSTAPLITTSSYGLRDLIGIDLSAGMGTTAALFNGPPAALHGIKTVSGWTPTQLIAGTPFLPGIATDLSDPGNFNYGSQNGYLFKDTGVYRQGGATDFDGGFSWRAETFSGTNFFIPFVLPRISFNNTAIGVPITVTLHVAHNAVGSGTAGALTDEDLSAIVCYPSDASSGMYAVAEKRADILGAPADLASSTELWVGDATGWLLQKISVTFTPAREGTVVLYLNLALASATIYVDPKAEVVLA